MPYPPGGLLEHRARLAANPSAFTKGKESAIERWVDHAWKGARAVRQKAGLPAMRRKQAAPLLREMAVMVWEAQGGEPLFHFGNYGDVCWNVPQRGLKNYITYEIGHMEPTSNGGSSEPENLCFQSGRCNQHIQSSLPIEQVVSYYFQTNKEVLERLERLKRLHTSERWLSIRKQVFSS